MKNYYNVTYKVSEDTWSANIAHAESEKAVQEYYKRKSTILIDVREDKVKLVDPKGLKDYYRLIGCHTVDIVCRRINGKYFNIICDDEGLLTENPKIAAIDKNRDPMLVGNLIIAGDVDDDGGLLGLNEEDVKLINANITTIRTMRYPKGYKVLANVEY